MDKSSSNLLFTNSTTFIKSFTMISSVVKNICDEHGFDIDKLGDGMAIALMHSELSEALQYIRNEKTSDHISPFTGVEEELADVIIRIMHYASHYKLDLASAIITKILYNDKRPYKHGKKF